MNVAVVIPCLNEESSIGKVVRDLLKHFPATQIYVLDNGSTDRTHDEAIRAGARVIRYPYTGKGRAMRHAFSAIDSDYFLTIDGDDTYPVESALPMIEALSRQGQGMIIGSRIQVSNKNAFPRLHYLANEFLVRLVNRMFRGNVGDVLSGLRVFDRHSIDLASLEAKGFEIETEMTIKFLLNRAPVHHLAIPYRRRGAGSRSKIRTFADGIKILRSLLKWKFD